MGRLALLALTLAPAVAAPLVASLSRDDARTPIGAAEVARRAGRPVLYWERGRGEAVVLLADLGRPASDFNELVVGLNRASYRSAAVEAAGVGASQGWGWWPHPTLNDLAEDVAAVCDALSRRAGARVHVLGHGFGGRVARALADAHPQRIASLVLVSAETSASVAPELRLAVVASLLRFLPDALRERALRRAFFSGAGAIPPHWRSGWYFWAAVTQARAARAGSLPTAGASAGEHPTLLVRGADDPFAPRAGERVEPLAPRPEGGDDPIGGLRGSDTERRIQRAQIPAASRALLPEQPARLLEVVLGFLQAHPIGSDAVGSKRRPGDRPSR